MVQDFVHQQYHKSTFPKHSKEPGPIYTYERIGKNHQVSHLRELGKPHLWPVKEIFGASPTPQKKTGQAGEIIGKTVVPLGDTPPEKLTYPMPSGTFEQ